MNDMQDKEIVNMVIEEYSNAKKIAESDDPKAEAERQMRIAKAKLEAFGVIADGLEDI